MEELQDFLEKYKPVEYVEKEKNIFQIAGFPHYENVSSNVLAYFLKNTVVFKSLFSCISDDIFECNIKNITREEQTESGKRIDILINTDKIIIGIENKINAWLNNPMEDYYDHLQRLARNENKEWMFIILSKSKVEKNEKYVNILYSDFAVALRKNYSQLLNSLGYRYFFFLNEYIENIESFNGGLYMNNEFVEIAKQNSNLKKIEQIITEGESLRSELVKIAYRILDDLRKYNKPFNVWPRPYTEPNKIFAIAAFDNYVLTDKNYNFVIDVRVKVDGFEIRIFERNGRFFDDEFQEILAEILSDLYEKFETEYDPDDMGAYYKDKIKLEDYDKLIGILEQILDAFDKYIKSEKNGV
jgi:hypothetical protein